MGKEVVVSMGKGVLGVRETPATQASLICEQTILSHQDTSLLNTLPGKEIIRKPEK